MSVETEGGREGEGGGGVRGREGGREGGRGEGGERGGGRYLTHGVHQVYSLLVSQIREILRRQDDGRR